ncbi:hypothetical protein BC937DRAFT_94269 [Endogone sp. FLAS-F59071]|nr:hypothetical protein BC937DRAFT_94269 [Endogone sp. FLAS-F59071]|eukprot:RUS14149.1 hypothetical protein BC937DRAFT_94269 [Endogone sp. FLAS-F59071]
MFDNITYSKFVYAEDDIEPSSQLLLKGTDKQSTWFVKRGKSESNLLGAQPSEERKMLENRLWLQDVIPVEGLD